MAKTFLIDLSYFLDEVSGFTPDSSPLFQLVEYVAAIVALVSYPAPEPPPEYKVRCHFINRNGNQCPGHIVGKLVTETGDIYWYCPVCHDNGLISNWQGTLCDLSYADSVH